MIKRLFFPFLALAFLACEEEKPKRIVSPFVTLNNFEKKSRECLRDTICAEVHLQYPILTGGDNAAAINAINDSLRILALTGLLTDPARPVDQAFDSVGLELYDELRKTLKESPDWIGASYFKEVTTQSLLNTPKFLSFSLQASGYIGGAHPYYTSVLATYDLTTGKAVNLSDIVRDTAALRPMLESGFLAAKKSGPADTTRLSDLLFPEITRLPVSDNVCIVPDGLRFLYNPYEVAPWAVGATEILLSWQQLGSLADRKKWVD